MSQSASFELLCMEISSRVWAVRVLRITKTKIKIIKARDPYISPPRGGAPAHTIRTKLVKVDETRDVINLAKFQIKRIINVTW